MLPFLFPSQSNTVSKSSLKAQQRPHNTYQVFAKMSQTRSLPLKSIQLQPTSLRRSPRLLQLKQSPKTPKPKSTNPKICASNSVKISEKTNKSDNGSKILEKSANGSKCFEKSANGSRRTTRLTGKNGGFEDRRRSPRFCNEVDSSVNDHMLINGNFNVSFNCNAKSSKGSKKETILVGKNDIAMLDFVDSPATPTVVGEKKFMGVVGNGNDSEENDSFEEISMTFTRRITRSCSRLMGRKLEVEKIVEGKKEGKNLFNCSTRVARTRSVCSLVQSEAVKVDGGVTGKSCNNGKENRSGFDKGGTRGRGEVMSDSVSVCVNREGRKVRRNNDTDYHVKDGKTNDLCKEMVGNVDRRITRSASKQVGGGNDLDRQLKERRNTSCSSRYESGGKAESIEAKKPAKRIRRSSVSPTCIMEGKEEATTVVFAKEKKSQDCVKRDKLENECSDAMPTCHQPGRGARKKQNVIGDIKLTGIKRKRKQIGLRGTNQGWTKEQEVTLHRAYLTAKPSPHFWKEVAKLVPGKSAQECFDKVHSENQTPIGAKTSSRAKKQNSPSDFSASGNELFKSAGTKSKKPCKRKASSHALRKTVRHLLQKYTHVNQDKEADLFSVLEPSVNPSCEAFQLNAVQLTPKHLMKSPGSSSKSRDRSSSGHKKCLSRFSNTSESRLTSPPVLKKVKNMVLHEKYIDQLHLRECKRKVDFSRYMKLAHKQKDGKENSVYMKDIIRAAKEALVSDAKDAINNFRHSQANVNEAFSDSEEFLNSDNDKDEAEL